MKQNYKLLLTCILVSFTSLSQTVIRGPYLQKGTPTSVVVKWRTDFNTSSIIEYSTNTSYSSTISESTPKTEHELEITGLLPNTKYVYRIGTGGSLMSGSTDLFFKTHPNSGVSDLYRFWILGHTGEGGINNPNAVAVRDAYYSYIGSNDTDGIILNGDNGGVNGLDSDYQAKIFDMFDSKLKNTILWSCLGNQEGNAATSSTQTGPYYDIFTFPTAGESGGMNSSTESYYSFDYGNIHFIVLNSFDENRAIGSTMYNWAQNDLQNTTQKWTVAIWHHPPYSKGYHTSEGLQSNGDPAEIELIEMRQNFLPMLESNGVDLVVAGHSESYERSYLINGHYEESNSFNSSIHTIGVTGYGDGKTDGNGVYSKTSFGTEAGKGTVYVVTSTASRKVPNSALDHNAMFYSVSQLGSCILEIDGDNLSLKFLRDNGNIDDYFTLEKGPDCPTCPTCDDGILNGQEIGIDCGGPDCSDCPTCEDGVLNGEETGVDCGGPDCSECPPTCEDGVLNGNETEIDCGGPDCIPCPTCDDGILNGEETGIDCGGPDCSDCPPTCDDGIKNGNETGVDCGGPDCALCCTDVILNINFDIYPEETSWNITDTYGNIVANSGPYVNQPDSSTISVTECLPDACYEFNILDSYGDGLFNSSGNNGSYSFTVNGVVIASGGNFTFIETTPFCISNPTCDDGILNGDETGIDCGGPDCAECIPTCDDGVMNGNETGIDCGSPDCAECPTCDDGVINGNETGVDCGGPDCVECPPTCDDGVMNGNETDIDCGGPDCLPCPTCDDGVMNGDETGVDCGGPDCADCPPTCNDGILNGNETGVDCGGPDCSPCPTCIDVNITINFDIYPEETSWNITDTQGNIIANGGPYGNQPDLSTINITECLPVSCYEFNIIDSYGDGLFNSSGNNGSYSFNVDGVLVASGGDFGFNETTPFCISNPTCTDGIMNGLETGVDCGGPVCVECPPTCDDGVINGNETGIDCGGPVCAECPTCDDGVMNGNETGVDCGGPDCVECPPTCDDGVMNGNETDIDCGGPDCLPCPTCNDSIMNGDETGVDCGGLDCAECPPTCNDGILNGNETGVDCGGPDCSPCPTCIDVNITINFDIYPEETSWNITDTQGNIIASGGPYGNQPDLSTINITECLPVSCYEFNIIDSYGDGLFNSSGNNGSYSFTVDGVLVTSGGNFGFNETTPFCISNPTCTDAIMNGLETGVDCGGPVCVECPPTCDDGVMNGNETGIDCGGPDCSECPTCDDGVMNGNETDVDCGGPDCVECPPTCDDGVMNGDETGIDCGGPDCAECPTCDDGVMNGNETGVDCGGPDCADCPPTCNDGILNGNETGVDCGGPDCSPCPTCIDVNLIINFDIYPEEISWNITDNQGNIVANGGPYGNQPDLSTINITECLPVSCYEFNIIDSYGDGLFNSSGNNGSYSFNVDGVLVASGGNFGFIETTPFCIDASSNSNALFKSQKTLDTDYLDLEKLTFTPNPFNDYVNIKLPLNFNNNEFSVKVFDLNGRLVIDRSYTPTNSQINVTGLEELVQAPYIFKIRSMKSGATIHKLLISK